MHGAAKHWVHLSLAKKSFQTLLGASALKAQRCIRNL